MFACQSRSIRLRRLTLSLIPLACLSSLALAAAAADDAAPILARMREAAGTHALLRQTEDLLIRGKSTRPDSPGEYSLRFTSGDRFLRKIEGPLADSVGCDGTHCWSVDRGGIFRTLEFFDLDSTELLIGLQTGQWLAHVDSRHVAVGAKEGDAKTVVLAVTQGGLKAKLFVNQTTWLPGKLTWSDMSGEQAWIFSRYRDHVGWKIPSKIVIASDGKNQGSYEVCALSRVPASPPAYEPPESKLKDVHFDPNLPAKILVKRAITGHVMVRPTIDGVELGWFIFDTGAGGSTILHNETAARLKLTPVATNRVAGVYGSFDASILRARSLALGRLTIEKPLLVAMDLSFLRNGLGKDVVGIVGYDLLSRCVAQITLVENSIELHDPRDYQLPSGHWQRLAFCDQMPLVPANFDGGKGIFRIDVGASAGPASNVIFHAPTVDELKLLTGRKTKEGQFGTTRVAIGKIGWFELAGHRFENPSVVFALDHHGPLGGDEYTQGNLGVNFLKLFRLVLDYPHERVALVPLGAAFHQAHP